MTEATVILWVSLIAVFVGLVGLLIQLGRTPAATRPTLGTRGLKRASALERSAMFRLCEPLVRYVAAWAPPRALGRVRGVLVRWLRESGDHLGLDDSELLAASVLSGVALAAVVILIAERSGLPAAAVPVGAAFGALLPPFRVRAVAKARARHITKALPGFIELAAMCMSAGLDLPRSLRRIVESSASADSPIVEEIRRVLRELDLGRTRRDALLGFAERVPTDEVRELVNSIVQSEARGTPLARVLTIQARTLRLRRSASAEEAASGAALMLVGPMTLIFACVIVLLMGPVILRVMGGGLTLG